MVATDAKSLWEDINHSSVKNDPTGMGMWTQLMKRIGKQTVLKPSRNQKFQDDMLKEWVRQKLQTSVPKAVILKAPKQNPALYDPPPGTLVRASTPVVLDEQVFHQSLVLILDNDEFHTVGVVLNRPSSTSLAFQGEEMTVRYGGQYGLKGTGRPEIWLHYNNAQLQEAKVGTPVGKNNENDDAMLFWRCTREDAETAVDMGLAKADDFLVFLGLSIWNKNPEMTGTKPPAVGLGAFFTNVEASAISTVWKLLKCQEPLSTKNIAENLEAANAAWMLSGDASWMLSGSANSGIGAHSSDMETEEQQVVQSLAYTALDQWIRMFLLKP
jgi:hypothetical protein